MMKAILIFGLLFVAVLSRRANKYPDDWPENGRELRVLPKINATGRSRPGRRKYVTGGFNANRAHWPFIVPIFQLKAGRTQHICGGSIVHPKFIVTAAHCFRNIIRNQRGQVARVEIDVDRRGYKVHIGDYNINLRTGLRDGAYAARIERIIVHENYKGTSETDQFDIALIKLAQPLRYNNFVKQIPIAPANAVFDTGTYNCHAAGWGLTATGTVYGETRTKPDILQQLDHKIIPAKTCQVYWGKWMGVNNMCLGNGGRATCRGDSGGPAVCPYNNQFVLAGIMSFGFEDCISKPGVLLKIPPLVPWLQAAVKRWLNVRG